MPATTHSYTAAAPADTTPPGTPTGLTAQILFEHAVDRVLLGFEKKGRLISPEAVGWLGHTLQLPTTDKYLLTEPELEDRISVMLGGRARWSRASA